MLAVDPQAPLNFRYMQSIGERLEEARKRKGISFARSGGSEQDP
jgi:hypothetical protein